MINVAIAAVLAASLPDAQSKELTDDEVRDQVKAYLGSIDTPITAKDWQALGPRANPLLEEIARDPKQLPTRRAKAIDGLASLNGPQAPALLAEVAAHEEEPVTVRLAAVRGLGRVTPERRSVSVLRPLLEGAKDSRVRAVAGEQLAQRTHGRSCDLIRAQAARESGQGRGHFRRALSRCAAAQ